jgi:hypothetical protein
MHPDSTRDVTLVLGGVRSGKSRYALELAARTRRVTFLATAERREDQEMQRKIERHRAERPQHWATIEEPQPGRRNRIGKQLRSASDRLSHALCRETARGVDLMVVGRATLDEILSRLSTVEKASAALSTQLPIPSRNSSRNSRPGIIS